MSTLPAAKPGAGTAAGGDGLPQLAAAIGRSVMAALGRPADFLRVTVRKVTDDNYRVNVVTGADPSSARVAHSYFVAVDAKGNLTASTPALTKLYAG